VKRDVANKSTNCGIIVSGAWIVGAIVLIIVYWSEFKKLPPNGWAEFAAGVAAPLAFLWLVLGYFLQRQELELQRKELKLQRQETARLANEANRQANSIEANECLARRDLFSRVLDQTVAELDSIAARILISCKQEPIIEHRKAAETAKIAGYKDAYLTELIAVFRRRRADWTAGHQGDVDQLVWWCLRLAEAECESEIPRYLALTEALLVEARFADEGGSLERFVRSGRAFDLYNVLIRFRTYSDELQQVVPKLKSWLDLPSTSPPP
jgi:hypothetical protein